MVQEYINKFPNALLNYQYIEEALKQYIYRTDIMQVAQSRGTVDSQVSNQFTLAIKKIPFEYLIKMFARRNINSTLIKKLNNLPLRTKLVSFQDYLSRNKDTNNNKLQQQLLSFDNVVAHSENCVHELFIELGNLEKSFEKVNIIN